MSAIKSFVFNPFAENTFIVYDKTGECIIIDPGCFTKQEEDMLVRFIEEEDLKPVKLINTHTHIDHVIGNAFVTKKFGIAPHIHRMELPLLEAAPQTARSYGVEITPSPAPEGFLKEGEKLTFGETQFDILFTPGHSPGHVSLYNRKDNYVLSGDVLFQQSIGRYDLPGGNLNVLLQSITDELLTLPDETTVYCGHGPFTTIGEEKKYNPFLNS